MRSPSGYDIVSFGDMVECEPRMSAYAEALQRAITPGCTVIDIGAGFGIFSLLACRYGAGKVIAIEPDPAIELLMPIAQANGFADRITPVRDISRRFTPERKADVIISDIRGMVPLFEHHIETIVDARERLLAPGGVLIPLRDTIKLAPVHAPQNYRRFERPWVANDYELDLSPAADFAVNMPDRAQLDRAALLAEPCELAVLDYRAITDPNLDASAEFVASSHETAHGLLLWFEAELAEGIRFSNGPGDPPLIYDQKFFPFEEPLRLAPGDRIRTRIRARFLEGRYVWSWETNCFAQGGDEPRRSFRQSTFKGRIFVMEKLKTHAHYQSPEPSPQMAIDRECLELVDGERSLEDIANTLTQRHPNYFTSAKQALRHVTRLLAGYRPE